MKYKYWWRLALALVTALVLVIGGREWNVTSQPIPAIAQAQIPPEAESPDTTIPEDIPVPAVEIPSESSFPLAEESYQDSANRFTVGILEDFRVTSIAGSPLFESPDGNLAYTVIAKPLIERGLLSESELGAIAINAFANGENFTPQPYLAVPSGGIVIPWRGSLTQGNNTQPINGTILARQTSESVLLLMISATEARTDQLDSALATLEDTLQPR